jgi:hypothetical protein
MIAGRERSQLRKKILIALHRMKKKFLFRDIFLKKKNLIKKHDEVAKKFD